MTMEKQAQYEALYEQFNPRGFTQEVKDKLYAIPEVKELVDSILTPEEWNAVKIGFWDHIPFYDEFKRAIYYPAYYEGKILGTTKDETKKYYESAQAYFKEYTKDIPKEYLDRNIDEYLDEYLGMIKASELTEQEMRMILHEISHYADHLKRGEQFIEETTHYYKDPEKKVIDMDKYFASPAEQQSFLTEIRYMRSRGKDDDYIIRKMTMEYGGKEEYWKEIISRLERTASLKKQADLVQDIKNSRDLTETIHLVEQLEGKDIVDEFGGVWHVRRILNPITRQLELKSLDSDTVRSGARVDDFVSVVPSQTSPKTREWEERWHKKSSLRKQAVEKYVSFTIQPSGDLLIEVYPDRIDEVNGIITGGDAEEDILHTLFEWQLDNGWEFVTPESIGALTDSPILHAGDYYFWYPAYQLESPLKPLLDGKVTFQGAPSNKVHDQQKEKTREWEERWHKRSSLDKKAFWSVFDTQTGNYMATGSDSPTLREAVEDCFDYLISGPEFENMEEPDPEQMTWQEKKKFCEEYEFEFHQHTEKMMPSDEALEAEERREEGERVERLKKEKKVEEWQERWHKRSSLTKQGISVGELNHWWSDLDFEGIEKISNFVLFGLSDEERENVLSEAEQWWNSLSAETKLSHYNELTGENETLDVGFENGDKVKVSPGEYYVFKITAPLEEKDWEIVNVGMVFQGVIVTDYGEYTLDEPFEKEYGVKVGDEIYLVPESKMQLIGSEIAEKTRQWEERWRKRSSLIEAKTKKTKEPKMKYPYTLFSYDPEAIQEGDFKYYKDEGLSDFMEHYDEDEEILEIWEKYKDKPTQQFWKALKNFKTEDYHGKDYTLQEAIQKWVYEDYDRCQMAWDEEKANFESEFSEFLKRNKGWYNFIDEDGGIFSASDSEGFFKHFESREGFDNLKITQINPTTLEVVYNRRSETITIIPEQYEDLDYAGDYLGIPGLRGGDTEIWFANTIVSPKEIDMDDLKETHTRLGRIAETNLKKVRRLMQRKIWSPDGEGKQLLDYHEIKHDSLQEGDIIITDSVYYVTKDGFIDLAMQPSGERKMRLEQRKYLASTSKDPAILEKLSKDSEADIRLYVARNVDTPVQILQALTDDPEESVRHGVALNGVSTPEILLKLSADANAFVRNKVAGHLNTPVQALMNLAKDTDVGVRQAILSRDESAIPSQVLRILVNDADPAIANKAKQIWGRTRPPIPSEETQQWEERWHKRSNLEKKAVYSEGCECGGEALPAYYEDSGILVLRCQDCEQEFEADESQWKTPEEISGISEKTRQWEERWHRHAAFKNLTLQTSDVPESLVSQIKEIQKGIDKSILIKEEDEKGWIQGGLQQLFHMTILYGVEKRDEEEVSEIVKLFTEEGIEAKSGEIEYFDNKEKNHTCVVLRVESEELKVLHDLLKKEVANKDSYPTYKAHIAIAYIKYKERLGDIKIKPVTWQVKSIEMSQKDGDLKKVSKLYKRAAIGPQLWIDPEGKEYPIDSKRGHYGWILDNKEMLKEKGYLDVDETLRQVEYKEYEYKTGEGLIEILLQTGWVRMSGEGNFEVWDIRDGKSRELIEDYFAKYPARELYIDYFAPRQDSMRMTLKDLAEYGLGELVEQNIRFKSVYGSDKNMETIKKIVLEGGGKEPIAVRDYSEVDMGVMVFFHDNRKSQAALPLEDLSVENVAKKLAEKDAMWKQSGLEEYKHKRDFTVTDEPEGTVQENADMIWVLQRHEAEKAGLHGDFRLQEEGVLKSFVIRKLDDFLSGKLNRVLVINTEDHPIEYATFEGDIPSGEYGGGHMDIADAGTYETIVKTDKEWTFWLDSDTGKMKGLFTLVLADPEKFGKDKWFLIRKKESKIEKKSKLVLI